ncbi:MAG: amidohydrolase family protein, partial [Candidatus Cryptobacteroides sp.]
LSQVMDRHPNLFIDNSARHIETCVTPRATKKFYEKYQDRILFGTDNDPSQSMYDLQWRILETEDEHFYARERAYHWPLQGIGLSDQVLKKIYHDNALKIIAIQNGK